MLYAQLTRIIFSQQNVVFLIHNTTTTTTTTRQKFLINLFQRPLFIC